VLVSFTGRKKLLYYAGRIESSDNITGEREGKFSGRGRNDSTKRSLLSC